MHSLVCLIPWLFLFILIYMVIDVKIYHRLFCMVCEVECNFYPLFLKGQ